MVQKNSEAGPAVVSTQGSTFVRRELNGASFLTLEHVAHMVAVVLVAGLVTLGVASAISMWSGGSSMLNLMMGGGMMTSLLGAASKAIESAWAIGVVAALVVLVPALVVLDRRTRAEWQKREGYASRVAYKAPVYIALGVLMAAVIATVIDMLAIVLNSLALIGVSGVNQGSLYLDQFLPAVVGAIAFGCAAWYIFKLAKGRDYGKTFSMGAAVVSVVLVIALFITATISMHSNNGGNNSNYFMPGNSSQNFENMFNY